MKQLIFFLMLLIILIPLVISDAQSDYSYDVELLSPDITDLYPREINFSWIVTTSGVVLNTSDRLNCSILISNFSTTNFSILAGPFNVTNATQNGTQITMPYGETFWKVNCSTSMTPINQTHGESLTRSFNISTKPNYDTIVPADESTIDVVAVNFTWNFSVSNVNIGSELNCSIQATYNSTDGAPKDKIGVSINVTNATLSHQVLPRDNLRTTYWRMNCSNRSIDFLSTNFSFTIDLDPSFDEIVPVDGANLTGVDVNYSWRINATNFDLKPGNSLNCTVRNASSVNGEKSILFGPVNVTNATAYHQVFAMAPYIPFTNVFWNVNCTNGSITLISDNYTYGINVNQEYTWQTPDDNAVLGDLLVNFSWRPTVTDISLIDGYRMNCSVQSTADMTEGAPLDRLTTPINTTNNSIQSQIVTMGNRSPVAWRVNCSNGSIDFLSEVYNFFMSYSLETTIVHPSDDEILTSRFVNYSWTFESLNINLSKGDQLNCSIIRNGTAIITNVNGTNATETNTTVSTVNGHYNLTANCSNSLGELFSNITDPIEFTVSELVSEEFEYNLISPVAVDLLASTNVNFSWNVSVTGGFLDTGEQLECSLNNRSGPTGLFSQGFKVNITNSTYFSKILVMETDVYHEWFVNCTTPITQSNPVYELSETRIFEIVLDAILYKY